MTLTNLGEPDWFQISCKTHILSDFLCVKSTNNSAFNYYLKEIRSTKFCSQNCILFNNTCYKFLWQKPTHLHECFNFNEGFAHGHTIAKFSKQLINYVSVERAFPLFLVYSNNKTTVVLKVQKYNKMLISVIYTYLETKEVFQTCQPKKRKIFHGTMTFTCSTGGYIHSENVCDGYIDCPNDKSDENTCTCETNLRTSTCKLVIMTRKITSCSNLYYLDNENQCHKYKDVNLIEIVSKHKIQFKSNDTISEFHISSNWSNDINKFECNNGKIISSELVDDLVADCRIEADDEPILKSMLLNGSYFECEHPS